MSPCTCWITEKPEETFYRLIMFSDQGDAKQEVEMTRAEYIALKEALARARCLLNA